MENFVTAFHIDWKLILAQAINFAVVVFVLYRFAIKPLTKNLNERKAVIEKGLNDANKNEELLKKTEEAYEAALKQARAEGVKIIDTAKKEADVKKKELIVKAEEEIKAMAEQAKKSLVAEKQKIMEEAKVEIAELVILSTEKVLGKTVTKDMDKKLIDSSIA